MARCEECKANKVCDHNRFGFENCGNFIPADVVERKRGEWKKSSHPILGTHFDCSVCKCEWYVDGMRIDDDVNLAFCPNCGADMRGEKG